MSKKMLNVQVGDSPDLSAQLRIRVARNRRVVPHGGNVRKADLTAPDDPPRPVCPPPVVVPRHATARRDLFFCRQRAVNIVYMQSRISMWPQARCNSACPSALRSSPVVEDEFYFFDPAQPRVTNAIVTVTSRQQHPLAAGHTGQWYSGVCQHS